MVLREAVFPRISLLSQAELRPTQKQNLLVSWGSSFKVIWYIYSKAKTVKDALWKHIITGLFVNCAWVTVSWCVQASHATVHLFYEIKSNCSDLVSIDFVSWLWTWPLPTKHEPMETSNPQSNFKWIFFTRTLLIPIP